MIQVNFCVAWHKVKVDLLFICIYSYAFVPKPFVEKPFLSPIELLCQLCEKSSDHIGVTYLPTLFMDPLLCSTNMYVAWHQKHIILITVIL